MRLIRGAPGSGKTALVFREFKEALRAGVPDLHSVDLRIIVPTATLVRHFRHELARDGIVFSPKLIVSLSRFANERAPGPDPLPDDLLAAIVRECLRRNKIPEFAGVADTEGMVATIVETIALFENAACTPDKLAAVKRLTPHAKAFERIWRAVSEYQTQTGYRTRMEITGTAAANTQPARIWMDGFLSFSPLETELVRSLARSCDLTLTIDISPATNDIHKLALELGAKDQPLPAKSRKPQISVTEARSLEREADEIARRIVELNRAGVPFRQIGVAIGDTGAYLPFCAPRSTASASRPAFISAVLFAPTLWPISGRADLRRAYRLGLRSHRRNPSPASQMGPHRRLRPLRFRRSRSHARPWRGCAACPVRKRLAQERNRRVPEDRGMEIRPPDSVDLAKALRTLGRDSLSSRNARPSP